jgi:hypothetical protein
MPIPPAHEDHVDPPDGVARLRQTQPPAFLEERVLAAIRVEGHLPPARGIRRRPILWLAGSIAALIPLVIVLRLAFTSGRDTPPSSPPDTPSQIASAEVVWF